MPEFYCLLTDYEGSRQDLERKCAIIRAAFPDFGVLLSVTGSEKYYQEVASFVENYGVELLPPPNLTGLEKYVESIEVGYIGILDLFRELNKRPHIGSVYIESDLYPVHKEVANRVKERFTSGNDVICYPRSYASRMSGFLGDQQLVKAWGLFVGRTEAIQSPNFILGLSGRALEVIEEELNSPAGKSFLSTFKEVTKRHSTDASKYMSELLFTTLLKKRGFTFGPTWDDVYDPARHTLEDYYQFMQRLHDPGVYFLHDFKPDSYPAWEENQTMLYDFWAVGPKAVELTEEKVELLTEFPVAIDSPDHTHPWGTKHDNSSNLGFIDDVIRHFGKDRIRTLDLGCSGGQLAIDFNRKGQFGIGLEGSDWSLQHERPNWVAYNGKRLFTCDVSRPFQLLVDDEPAKFECITAWEVTEHIHPDRLDIYFENIWKHLSEDGVFIGSVALFPDDPRGGPQVHQSLFSEEYWQSRYFEKWFVAVPDIHTHPVRTSHHGFYHCSMKRDKI